MLYFRRICLLATLVLSFGASDLFAQHTPAPGISVKIVSPDSLTWVGPDHPGVVVDVHSVKIRSGLAAAGQKDTSFVRLFGIQLHVDENDDRDYDPFTDTDGDHIYDTGESGGDRPIFTSGPNVDAMHTIGKSFAAVNTGKGTITWRPGNTLHVVGEVRKSSGNVHIARYTITFQDLSGTAPIPIKEGVFVRVTVPTSKANSTIVGSATNLDAGGDNKTFNVDNVRPNHVVTSTKKTFTEVGVSSDLDGTVDVNESAMNTNDKLKFKVGDDIQMTAQVGLPIETEAEKVGIGLFAFSNTYRSLYASDPDSALGGVKLFKIGDGVEGAREVNGDIVLRHTVRVTENAFRVLGGASTAADADKDSLITDNIRFRVATFLIDRAGNRSKGPGTGTPLVPAGPYSGSDTAPDTFSTYTVDSKKPVITIGHPIAFDDPDSNRFTGLVTASFENYRISADDTGLDNVPHRPLRLKVQEGVDSLVAIIVTPKDSLVNADIKASYTDIGGFENIDTDGKFRTAGGRPVDILPSSKKGGQKVDLRIFARDSVGNESTKTVKGVIFDEDDPDPKRIFPRDAALPEGKINESTRHPSLRFAEKLDSLSVRFIQDVSDSPHRLIQQVGAGQLSLVDESYTVTMNDTLRLGSTYYFQLYVRDLAGNVHITDEDTLTYLSRDDFENPTADMFVVSTNVDSVLAGKTNMTLTIAAVDSMQRRMNKNRGTAVTYRQNVRVSAWDGDGLASTVVFTGGGAAKDEDGYYIVSGSGWNAGELTGVKVKSNTVIDNFSILVEDISEVNVDGRDSTRVNFSGKVDSLYVDADRMEKFKVTAWEDGEEVKTVSGEFGVNVVPTDKFGNPSIKKVTNNPALDTRLTNANKFTNFSVVLSSSNPRVDGLGSPLPMTLEGETFTLVAPDGDGELRITARVDNLPPGSTAKYLVATGSVTVDYSAVAPTAADSIAPVPFPPGVNVMDAPDDQGYRVVISFDTSPDHDALVDEYHLWRDYDLGDGQGPHPIRWGPGIPAIPGDKKMTLVVGVSDTLPTYWYVQAIGNLPSSPVSSKLSAASVIVSPRTRSTERAAAMDNIPPEAATNVDLKLDDLTVSWTLSESDGTIDTYRNDWLNTENEIPGVTGYEIMVGLSAGALYSVGKVDKGMPPSFELTKAKMKPLVDAGVITEAQLDELIKKKLPGVMVRVDALDPNPAHRTPSVIHMAPVRKEFMNAAGEPVFIVDLMTGDLTVDFDDFVAFAAVFNTKVGDDSWGARNVQADLNDDGTVDFADFILFIGSYDETATGPSTKPVILPPGVNENAEFSLRLGSERIVVGQNVFVDVSLANVQALMGYGFVLNYDADKFEFVEAAPATEDLLKTTGGETPLFSELPGDAGQVSIANAVVNASEISGGGDIVRLTFRVLQEFEENARFEIAEGLVFDPQQLSNPAVVAGVLDVQTTPIEFALLQNFPNPFNPETTIGYELAESADVTLQIYNVVGQVVRTLIAAESQSAGRYQMRWNGMDDRGVPVSSGVYFYQISAGEFQTVRKLMLLK